MSGTLEIFLLQKKVLAFFSKASDVVITCFVKLPEGLGSRSSHYNCVVLCLEVVIIMINHNNVFTLSIEPITSHYISLNED